MHKKHFSGVLLVVILFFNFFLSSCKDTDEAMIIWQGRYNYNTDEVYNMEIDEYGLPHINVKVNNEDLSMIFDTGNLNGIMIELDKARQLRLTRVDSWDGSNYLEGASGKYSVFLASRISLLGKTWTNQRAYESKHDGYDGSIGPIYISKERVTLDYKNKLIGSGDSKDDFDKRDASIMEIIKSDKYKGLIVVKGKVNGYEALIQINTGKNNTSIDPRLVQQLNLTSTNEGYVIDTITLGNYEFSVPNASKINLKPLDNGFEKPVLLCVGSDILSRVVMTIDYKKNEVILNK